MRSFTQKSSLQTICAFLVFFSSAELCAAHLQRTPGAAENDAPDRAELLAALETESDEEE
jgi:hypothetical protein